MPQSGSSNPPFYFSLNLSSYAINSKWWQAPVLLQHHPAPSLLPMPRHGNRKQHTHTTSSYAMTWKQKTAHTHTHNLFLCHNVKTAPTHPLPLPRHGNRKQHPHTTSSYAMTWKQKTAHTHTHTTSSYAIMWKQHPHTLFLCHDMETENSTHTQPLPMPWHGNRKQHTHTTSSYAMTWKQRTAHTHTHNLFLCHNVKTAPTHPLPLPQHGNRKQHPHNLFLCHDMETENSTHTPTTSSSAMM